MPLDPLLAVRVVSDTKDWWDQTLPFVSSLLGVVVGAVATYFGTIGIERHRRVIELRQTGLAIVAEIRAMQRLTEDMKKHAPDDIGFMMDTLRYVKVDAKAAPITRGAVAKAGQFPILVGEGIAEFVARMSNFRQQHAIVETMRREGVLTDEKLLQRAAMMKPFVDEVVQAGDRLAEAIEAEYGQSR